MHVPTAHLELTVFLIIPMGKKKTTVGLVPVKEHV